MAEGKSKCVIAINGKSLAIFGSNMGFLGEVVQNYEPFESETGAVAAARQKIKEMGREVEPEVSRPSITSIRYRKSRIKKDKRMGQK